MLHIIKANKFINPRWWVFSRILAATFGGYILATSSALFFGQLLLLSTDKYQALHTGMLLSFLIYACAAMWVFSTFTAKRAWLGLIQLNIAIILLTWLLMQVNS
ncbi:MAG: hypothetical protein ACJA0T_000267 [Colwellia sp.]